ncbi:MAG: sulfotransferase [Steroidobacteraceae bacterium]
MTATRPPRPPLDARLAAGLQQLRVDPRAAETIARELLAAAPRDARGQMLLALARRADGRATEALAGLQALTAEHPDWAPAQYELGKTLGMAGRPHEALAALLRAVQIRPDIRDAWQLIAELRLALGDPAGADRAWANHLAVASASPALRAAAAALCDDRLAESESLLQAQLAGQPDNVEALRMLAEVLARAGRQAEAERSLARVLELAPDFKAARYNHAVVLLQLGRATDCLAVLDRLLATDARNPIWLNLRANALVAIGEYDLAAAAYASVLARYPGNARIWLAYGHALRTAGRTDEAVIAYRKSLGLAPALGEAYWSLANLNLVRFAAADIDAMRSQLGRTDLDSEDRVHFHFALGKALEDAGAYAASFAQYAAGNALRRSMHPYDPAETTRFVVRSEAVFTAEFFAERAGMGSPDPAPIFVLGLPRSGSTLVEQILASHSQVEGTMELPDLAHVARAMVGDRCNEPRELFPEVLRRWPPERLAELGQRYLDRTRVQRKSGAPRFIDKMPNNWMYVGLIHLALPNARIIDTRRDPMSCCFSNYKQLFASGQAFTYDFADLADCYRDYRRLMAHFDAVLPGRVHRVFYDRLVTDTETEIRALLAACGLPFEDACLRFHETRRAVRTPSSEQVRRPIFRDGLEQWRNYAAYLEPLRAALGPLQHDFT